MKIATFDEFVKDYNQYYHCNVRVVHCNTNDIEEVIFNIYDTYDFEIDYDREIIELY